MAAKDGDLVKWISRLALVASSLACALRGRGRDGRRTLSAPTRRDMVLVEHSKRPPASRHARLASFWIDAGEVTNRRFAEFVNATGYVTTAEEAGRAWVFDPFLSRWSLSMGANWRRPTGLGSSIAAACHRPVVQVSWLDAAVYAQWAGKRLPSEVEWHAAYQLSGHAVTTTSATATGRSTSTTSQASRQPRAAAGPLNLAHNVWEWCADWDADDRARGAAEYYGWRTRRRVQRGSAAIAAGRSAQGYRDKQMPHVSHNHVGFRCALNAS